MKMKRWQVEVYASETIEVEAETMEDAEEIAVHESTFSTVDYCEAEEINE